MAKQKEETAPTTVVEHAVVPTGTDQAADANAAGATATDKPKKTRAPRDPNKVPVRWNDNRRLALIDTIRANPTATYKQLADLLQAHPTFDGDRAVLTGSDVSKQIQAIEKATGKKLPRQAGSEPINADLLGAYLE